MVVRADGGDHPYNKKYYDNRRYHDREGRDYHVWNEGEDRAYRFYLNDQHKEYREWRNVRGPEQQEYFRWRHTHPDSVIVVKKGRCARTPGSVMKACTLARAAHERARNERSRAVRDPCGKMTLDLKPLLPAYRALLSHRRDRLCLTITPRNSAGTAVSTWGGYH